MSSIKAIQLLPTGKIVKIEDNQKMYLSSKGKSYELWDESNPQYPRFITKFYRKNIGFVWYK